MSPSELDGNEIDARKNKDRRYRVSADAKGFFNRRNQPIQDPHRNVSDPAQIQRDDKDSRWAQAQRHGIPSPITSPVTELPAESFDARISRPSIERRDTYPQGNIRRRQEEPRQGPVQGPITPAELAAPEPVSRSTPPDRVPSDELARKGPPRRTERQQPKPEGAKSQDRHESRHQQTPHEHDRSSRRRSQPTKSSQKETKRQLRSSQPTMSNSEDVTRKEAVERSSGMQRSTDGNVPVEFFTGAPARETLPIAPGSAPPRKYQQRQRRPLDPPSSIPGPSNRPSMRREPVGARNPAPPGRHPVAPPISSLHEDSSVDTCSELTRDGSYFSRVSENTNDSDRRLAEEGERRLLRPSPSTLWKRLTKPGTREDM